MRSWKYGIHVLVWGVLYMLPYAISFEGQSNLSTLFANPGDFIHLLSFCMLVAFTYINYGLLLPRLFERQAYFLYFACVLIGFGLVIGMPGLFIGHGHGMDRPPHHGGPHRGRGGPDMPLLFGRSYNIILFVVIVFISMSLYNRLQVLRLQQEKTNAELAFLKAQVHPHFLFNALNGIYALALQGSANTADAVLRLSGLMRYLLVEGKDDRVPLRRELDYLDNYIKLQQLRLGDTVKLEYIVDGEDRGYQVAPLLLVPFIENAFKHGVNPDEQSHIRIVITIREGVLHLLAMNRKVSGGERSESSGIGMPNAKARLKQQYPGQHTLDIDDSRDLYAVNLTLHL
jgi:hypothetical protein